MELKSKITVKQSIKNFKNKIKEDIDTNKKIKNLIIKWKDIMYEAGLHTNSYNTFTLLDLKVKPYGLHGQVYATTGLNLEDLEKAKPYIETGIGCIFLYYVKKKGSNFAEVKFITEGFGGDKVKYVPPKTSPFELYLGNSVEGEPIIISVGDVSHFLLSGSNGSGKSRMLDCMLTTLIHNCDETELELYLAQISKNDLIIYEDAICCRAFCETLEQVEVMLNHIIKKMKERDKLIRPMRKDFKGSDIIAYNKLHPYNKLSICWLVFDEMASIMNKNGNDNETKKQKDRIVAMMEEIARVGRALGIFLGVCLQRPRAESLSPDVKAQANLRISFAQNNSKSSEVAMDDAQIAVGLDNRVAVYSCRGTGFDFVKTPYIDDKVIEKYVKPKSKRGHRNLFTDLEKLKKDYGNTDGKFGNQTNKSKEKGNGKAELPKDITNNDIKDINENKPTTPVEKKEFKSQPITFDKVDPNKIIEEENKIKEILNNIPAFVPYVPVPNEIIIDKTKITEMETQKPIRTNKGRVALPK